jgi:short-chain Z-isoprenyl diphosphate synthase
VGGALEGAHVGLSDLAYGVYERRLYAQLAEAAKCGRTPKHVGVILDGNRRWASAQGSASSVGHAAGAAKIVDFLGWCDDADVEVVTLWLLSTDNLARPHAELEALLGIIEETVQGLVGQGRWRLHPVGALDLLPDHTARILKEAEEATSNIDGSLVNVAVGYGGRREVVDAVRSLLQEHAGQGTTLDELAQVIDVEHIAEHLYTKGQPDPDLVIRTSGEQRLSGFLMWQSAHSEFYFCEAFWPDFRKIDFLRAMRAYAERQRRFWV